jgi:hypothetical protein
MGEAFRKLAVVLAAGLLIIGTTGTSPAQAQSRITKRSMTGGVIHRLMRLKNRVANHSTPDAIVYVPPGFDPEEPIHLVIYNHGLTNNLDEALEIWELDKAMTYGPPNTLLMLPEWAYDPEAYSSRGDVQFSQPGFFRKMLAESLSMVPEMRGKNIESLHDIAIATYSGGFRPTMAQLYKNDLEKKIVSVSFLDSLYRSEAIDKWLKDNIHYLSNGRKLYHNFYFDTDGESVAQYRRLQSMLSNAGIKNPALINDTRQTKVLPAREIARHGIVFKQTTISTKDYTPHMNVAKVYFPEVMKALNMRHQDTQIAASRQQYQ